MPREPSPELVELSARYNPAVKFHTLAWTAVVALGAALVLTPLGSRVATTFEPPTSASDEDLIERLEPSAAGRVALYRIAFQRIVPGFRAGPEVTAARQRAWARLTAKIQRLKDAPERDISREQSGDFGRVEQFEARRFGQHKAHRRRGE